MKKVSIFIIIIFTFQINLISQNTTSGKRPKVAVVLSGGGAKGMAHVGFLRVMEQAGIHPDLIVGTSMGSIVGGLYSIGFSIDSIEEMIRVQDWSLVLSNQIDLRQISVEEKEEYGEYIMEFPIKGWIPQLPSGAIKGHELELLFDRLTWTAAKDSSFDDFPIQFRCVAVDILTGEQYIFDKGSLTTAMRSSMSIPTIMEPVKHNGKLLVDGGLVNNFPVDVAQDLGADIIIGVYVGGQLLPEEDLNSVIKLLKQSSLLASIIDAKKKVKFLDVYIEPPLHDLSVADFQKSDTFVMRGYKESMKHYDELLAISKRLKKYTPKKIKKQDLIDSLQIFEFETNKINNKNSEKMVNNMLGDDLGGYITPENLHENINRLYGTRLFDKIGYTLFPINPYRYKINYFFAESPTKTLNFALNYSTDNKVGLIFQLVLRNMFLSGSKLEAKFRLSEFPSVRVRYLKYLGKENKSSLAFAYRFYNSDLKFYDNQTAIIESQYNRSFNSFDFEYNYSLKLNSLIKGILSYQNFDYNIVTGYEYGDFVKYKLNTKIAGLVYHYNSFDKKYFPKKGMEFKLAGLFNFEPKKKLYYHETDTVFQGEENPVTELDSNYLQLKLIWRKYNTVYKKLTIINSADMFAVLNKSDYQLNSFLVGGVLNQKSFYNLPFYGMPTNYGFANNGLIYRLGVRYEFIPDLYFGIIANGMFETNTLDYLFADISDYNNYYFGGGLSISYDSPIGPMMIVMSKNTSINKFWTYFSIGYSF